jgi:DNA-binding NarL/FixJ family response regulator
MSQSARLRATDIRAISRLVGECRELGDDSIAWRRHLLTEVARLVGSAMAVEYEGVNEPSGPFEPIGVIDWGWENGDFNRAAWVRMNEEFARRGTDFNPMIPAYFAAIKSGRGPCLTRSDVLPDSQWYRSCYYQDYHVTSGADVMMYCFLPMPASDGQLSDLVLVRPLRERDFTAQHRTLVQKLHEKITALIGGPLARFSDASPSSLPPRVRLVLRCLLEGDSDQHIAARMKISRYTVNEYVDRIFRHFGVQSRPELLARWIRRRWREPLAEFTDPSPVDLPPRPRQVLRCLLEGDSNKQVARRLGLSRYTVKEYVDRIYRHFGVQSRQELLARWIRRSEPEA